MATAVVGDRKRSVILLLVIQEFCDETETEIVLNQGRNNTSLVGQFFCSQESRKSSVNRIQNYVEEVIPLYNDVSFASHFRMQPRSFEELCKVLAPHVHAERGVTLKTKVLSTLWLLGNQESYRSVADRFNMSKGSLHLHVLNTCHALETVMPSFISFPQPAEYHHIAASCMKRCGFPGVVGIVDGTHIPIPGPSVNRDSYINRKGFPSMHLQVVADHSLQFRDIYTGYCGSVHDSRVFKNSDIGQLLSQGHLPEEYHLIGDTAYPLTLYLMTPYRDNGHLSPEEKHYNNALSRTRADVERSIGRLKGKFRRLKYLDMVLLHAIPMVIAACCVLHNFILQHEPGDDEEFDGEVQEPPVPPSVLEIPSSAATHKRHNLTYLIP